MRNLIIAFFTILLIGSCNNVKTKTIDNTKVETKYSIDTSAVNIFYFHGKVRCKTCIAVGNIAEETVKKNFANNNVHFIDINTSKNGYEELIEKYEVTWNALIVANGNKSYNLTDKAFATALDNPDKLKKEIIGITNSMLEKE